MDTSFYREKKQKNYSVIDNTFLQDTRLSWDAKGVMCYLLSLPEDWNIYMSELETHSSDGKTVLKTAIKELQQFGYLKKKQKKDEKGRFSSCVFMIYEIPCPLIENLSTDNPPADNRQLLNTNNTNNVSNQILNDNSAIPPESCTDEDFEYDEDAHKVTVDYMQTIYPKHKGVIHPRIKQQQFDHAYRKISMFMGEHDISREQMLEIMTFYLTNHSEYPIDHNINHFVFGDNLKWQTQKAGIKDFTDVFDNH